MYIGENLSTRYSEVRPTDTVAFALDKVNELHVHQLPVVKGKEYLGLITEEDLLSAEDEGLLIQDLKFTFPFIYLFDYQHIYDALQFLETYQFDLLPIINKQKEYVGVLTQKDLLRALNQTLSNQDKGAIIVLEMEDRDNSLTHVAHIIESENTKILSTGVRMIENSTKVELTIKVNKNNISSVLASLWRHDYVVKATFNDGSDQDDIQDRYNLLMNYLNI
ncbi:CBS domain-containing protein [Sphingobacterium lactis]|uniref:CBS domain-containing protein n=1 Tax=Sphingobacterium lactis TaxID=797291 RepID=A0A1H6B4K5_9SPHI|nr:CBS domain-containing protein [Sphingobacterium lactis]SEG55781.1 CBS domain-containing protein [Sphingobacterium lactis]